MEPETSIRRRKSLSPDSELASKKRRIESVASESRPGPSLDPPSSSSSPSLPMVLVAPAADEVAVDGFQDIEMELLLAESPELGGIAAEDKPTTGRDASESPRLDRLPPTSFSPHDSPPDSSSDPSVQLASTSTSNQELQLLASGTTSQPNPQPSATSSSAALQSAPLGPPSPGTLPGTSSRDTATSVLAIATVELNSKTPQASCSDVAPSDSDPSVLFPRSKLFSSSSLTDLTSSQPQLDPSASHPRPTDVVEDSSRQDPPKKRVRRTRRDSTASEGSEDIPLALSRNNSSTSVSRNGCIGCLTKGRKCSGKLGGGSCEECRAAHDGCECTFSSLLSAGIFPSYSFC